MTKTIYVLIHAELFSQTAYWERMTLEAIYRRAAYRRLQVYLIRRDQLSKLPRSAGPVLIVVSVLPWLMETLAMLQEKKIPCIVVGDNLEFPYDGVSVVRLDQSAMAERAVHYCYAANRRRIAFLAHNQRSLTDRGKVQMLKRTCSQLGIPFGDEDIFLFKGDILECIDRFVQQCDPYDAVICANDVSGLQLLHSPALLARKRIPEDLYVISYGNTLLSRISNPTLTTISLDYSQIGAIAVDNAIYLRKNPEISCQHTTLRGKITLGASTNYENPEEVSSIVSPKVEVVPGIPSAYDYASFYADNTVRHILHIEGLLKDLDKTALYIVLMLLRGYRKSELLEALYISESTYKYRLRKICTTAGVKNKNELLELLQGWIDPVQLDAHLEKLSMTSDEE